MCLNKILELCPFFMSSCRRGEEGDCGEKEIYTQIFAQ